ncbi:MAG: flagellar motor protein MotB [Planctomycetaceae bacterium]
MARKKKCPSGPNNGYLISFGDTMTALLAFFIVLNSLAEEQNGAALHAGTGSFMESASRFGLPGSILNQKSNQPFQLTNTSPKFVVPDEDNRESESAGTGPDDDPDDRRIIDRQKEDFHRFLQEVRRINHLTPEAGVAGEVSFDILARLPKEGRLMTNDLKTALNGIGPMLRQADYAVEITVWATTPSKSAWSRAVSQSEQLMKETVEYLRLPPSQIARLKASAQPWISKTVKRPTVSVKLTRLKPAEMVP